MAADSTNRPRSANEALPGDRLRAPRYGSRGAERLYRSCVICRPSRTSERTASAPSSTSRATSGSCAFANPSSTQSAGILPTGRTTDTQPHAIELGRPQGSFERAQAVVAGRGPSELHPERAEREVDVIVHRDHVVGLEVVLACQRGDRRAALVHERARLREQHAFGAFTDLADVGGDEPRLAQPRVLAVRELVHHAVAEVVTGLRVALAGVAEPSDEPGHGGEGV